MKLADRNNIYFEGSAWQHQNSIAHGASNKHKYSGPVPSNPSYGLLQAKSINKPLREGVSTQTFKGSFIYKVLKPKPAILSQNVVTRAFNALEKISKPQHETYKAVLNNYVKALNDPKFREKINISENEFKNINLNKLENIVGPAKKNIVHKFLISFFEPVTRPAKWLFVKAFANEKSSLPIAQKAVALKKQQEIQKQFASVEGLVNFVIKSENGYRKKYQLPHYTTDEKLLIPDDLLISEIRRNHFKSIDLNKGQYSPVALNIGNRVVSGAVAASFLSVDAFNTTMALTNDRKVASAEKKSRFSQEVGRIGTTAYLMSVVMNVFKEPISKSLYNALFASGVTIAISEIVGRKLVGKAILPSDKETLDRMEKEKNEGTGPMNYIGRLMSGQNPRASVKMDDKPDLPAAQTKAPSNTPVSEKTKAVSFSGGLKEFAPKMFKTKEVFSMLDLLKKIDPQNEEFFEDVIAKGVKNTKTNWKNAVASQENIAIGSYKTTWSKVSHSFFSPVHWVKGPIEKISKFISGKKFKAQSPENIKQYYAEQIKQNNLQGEFDKFKSSRLEALADNSRLNPQDLTNRLMKEFIENNDEKFKQDLEGVQNTLLWLKKQVIANAPEGKKDLPLEEIVNTLITDKRYETQLKDIQKKLCELAMKADGSNHTEYNSATYAVMNVNMGRLITSMFLMIDAYNLTMQHSNNDKQKSIGNLKDRAAQEASRVTSSAYILTFARTFFNQFHNAFLLGALLITGAECTTVETVSRKLVGRPVTQKDQDELIEQDKKNQASKNPVMKFLIYVLGKKGQAIPKPAAVESAVEATATKTLNPARLSSNPYINELLYKGNN